MQAAKRQYWGFSRNSIIFFGGASRQKTFRTASIKIVFVENVIWQLTSLITFYSTPGFYNILVEEATSVINKFYSTFSKKYFFKQNLLYLHCN